MITPLKDRFGSQIRTHYPLEVATEMHIVRQEARTSSIGDVVVQWPEFMEEIISTISHTARASTHVSQRSGVSVRLSVSNYETLAANAVRRALRVGETQVAPRVSDLVALAASTAGKIEIESMEEGRESIILENIVKASVLQVFKQRVTSEKIRDVLAAFDEGVVAHAGEDVSSSDYVGLFANVPALRDLVGLLVSADASQATQASAVEFVLEGLHLSKRLNKDSSGARSTYRSRT
jgi:magnesium chelatase subunit I